jgi:hypothetical protein
MIMESIIAYGRLKCKKLMLGGYSKKLDIRPKYHLGCYFKKPYRNKKNGIQNDVLTFGFQKYEILSISI